MIIKKKRKNFSYSFSFSKNTCDNLRYYKKTHTNHQINEKSEEFVLDFISKEIQNITGEGPKRGRPKQKIGKNEIYMPYSFSFKKNTIKKIKEYKSKSNMPSLDNALEKYLNLQIPVHIIP